MLEAHHKDPAMGNLGYDRVPEDFYATPIWLVENIIPHLAEFNILSQGTRVWECACGEGAISKTLINAGVASVRSTDLVYRGYGERTSVDFLRQTEVIKCDLIMTNPPYGKLAEQFVRHALDLMSEAPIGCVGMLLRNEWDCAKNRRDLFENHPAYRLKISTTTRPRWIADSTGSPRHNYAWFFWDWANPAPHRPVIRYVNQTK